ncbi:hypothetical protein EV363DRAFT_1312472 [Boletus edulis]|uniref:Uncharacterized protein n=1 Tax=Boletus edulis BED1 TaxID=1328754 RepID=A0AAD4C1Y7_BOLED|nr:hypothetical protein EV363DRAFT_1312472 [Boletus edulis]KAF8445774.1 hypothetical protein L210DRAFT_3528377 [Boletus edulis BED1]
MILPVQILGMLFPSCPRSSTSLDALHSFVRSSQAIPAEMINRSYSRGTRIFNLRNAMTGLVNNLRRRSLGHLEEMMRTFFMVNQV